MRFARTASGKVSKYLFHREPVVWVEGPLDIIVYAPLAEKLNFRLEDAGGSDQVDILADQLRSGNLPYVVIRDGDYVILSRQRSRHRRIVLLQRYAAENYLCEKDVVERVVKHYARQGKPDAVCSAEYRSLVTDVEAKLLQLVILDVAGQEMDPGVDVLPKHGAAIWNADSAWLELDESKIERLCTTVETQIDAQLRVTAERKVQEFLKRSRLLHLLEGHLLFSLLREFIFRSVLLLKGKKPGIDNDGLYLLLAHNTWLRKLDSEHRNFVRRLQVAVADATVVKGQTETVV